MASEHPDLRAPIDPYVDRHLGPRPADVEAMLATVGYDSLDALVATTMPDSIRLAAPLDLGPPRGMTELTAELQQMAADNRGCRSFIGMGYHDCLTPPVIKRNVLENPGWYTPETPSQAESAQGRLEALLIFQTMIVDLCALPVANASLLDEATAAAEAMGLCRTALRNKRSGFFVAADTHPQNLAVVRTRADALGVTVYTGDPTTFDFGATEEPLFGALLQYPTTDGRIVDYREVIGRIQAAGALAVVCADLLALTLLTSPGELGADVAVGSAQRFGVPLGYGGPHAGFLATTKKLQRLVPGRIAGVSKDSSGAPALRLALQTREQHIRREKAISNICTAQVLLAVMTALYAVWHGPEGILRIARRVHGLTATLAAGLSRLGYRLNESFFDTLAVEVPDAAAVMARALAAGINLRAHDDGRIGIALDETVTLDEVQTLLGLFAEGAPAPATLDAAALASDATSALPPELVRTGAILTHTVFSRYHSETEMMRYLHRLEVKDLALNEAMIPLGSCTMKATGAVLMEAVTNAGFAGVHPFVPKSQAAGYQRLLTNLEGLISTITGFPGVSLQPNAGSQGELTGLLVIRAHQRANGQGHRDVCLIPKSAHGTNPASAVMAGMRVEVVDCDDQGNIDVDDLRARAAAHKGDLAALMVTYPSTHGVFETAIQEICQIIHDNGGQVYMDGANLNAMVGLSRPADLGADVCHLNLHKTFAIPHGGGGPGMGPIAGAAHLAPFMPGHPVVETGGEQAIGAIAAAPWGSAGVLPISWAYIQLMGGPGLLRATQVAILNANYMAKRLEDHYPVVYRGNQGLVAHEFIIDMRPFKDSAGISVDDVAKRLIDFGFHAPTMSFPVAGTLMVEPTESESKEELDRFCDAMITIREEIAAIEKGELDRENNPLTNAPHTIAVVSASEWTRPYPREQGAFPAPYLHQHKYWPPVGRVDNVYGDRNFVGACLEGLCT